MSRLNQTKAETRLEKKPKPKPKKSVEMQRIFFSSVEKTLLIFTSWSLSQVHNHKHDTLFCPHIFTELYC